MTLTNNFITEIRDDVKDKIEEIFVAGAVGTDGTVPASSQTSLPGEVFRNTPDDVDSSVADAVTLSLRLGTSDANGNALQEIGWFNTATPSSGTMWLRNTFTTLNKTSDLELFFDTTVTVSVTDED